MPTTNPTQNIGIGIDIGGTTTKFGLVHSNGTIIAKDSLKTTDYHSPEDFVEGLFDKINPFIKKHCDNDSYAGIGIGAPNANYYTGTIEHAPNLPWKGIIHFSDLMTKKFGKTCKLTNDANAAALGEMLFGAAKGLNDFIMITLGTGVGSGIISNGKLIYGHDGFAGELGHTIVKPGGRKQWRK